MKGSTRPDGKPSYAPDGVLSADWRLVRSCPVGGRVKAWGCWWESAELAPFIGKWVWVVAGEYWVVWISVFEERWDKPICEIIG